MDPALEVRVECYSGSYEAERPRAICWGEERFEVVRVVNQWRTPYEKGFLVRTDDGKLIELHAVSATGRWWARLSTGQENVTAF
jgi:hypothetical protein